MNGEVTKIVLVIAGVDSKQTLERWAFDVQADQPLKGGAGAKGYKRKEKWRIILLIYFLFIFTYRHEKSEKDLVKEIQAVIRQITASVSFLPLLEEPCKSTFVYKHF